LKIRTAVKERDMDGDYKTGGSQTGVLFEETPFVAANRF
jgi:hypothetical protein